MSSIIIFEYTLLCCFCDEEDGTFMHLLQLRCVLETMEVNLEGHTTWTPVRATQMLQKNLNSYCDGK